MERKRAKIHMLPTESNTQIHKIRSGGLFFTPSPRSSKIKDPYRPPVIGGVYDKGFHLYITTDEEIKEEDWVLWLRSKSDDTDISQANQHLLTYIKLYPEDKDYVKIIASTDQQLRINSTIRESDENSMQYGKTLNILPQPSQAFIEKYCKLGGIDEVDVEYEIIGAYCEGCNKVGMRHCAHADTCGHPVDITKPKVDPVHNTITIHAIKNSWSKEEILAILHKASNSVDGCGCGDAYQLIEIVKTLL